MSANRLDGIMAKPRRPHSTQNFRLEAAKLVVAMRAVTSPELVEF